MDTVETVRIVVEGKVQGVGMRPFLYRKAVALGLSGETRNTGNGLEIRLRGKPHQIESLLTALTHSPPQHAIIHAIESSPLTGWQCPRGFHIVNSLDCPVTTTLPADRAICSDCLQELYDPANRRYRHPFISCTQCGPRHSIVQGLPWDRYRTSMAAFTACAACKAEVADPGSRRFHSQTNSCHHCGPRLQFDESGESTPVYREPALERAIRLLRDGGLLAIKGPGGFQLVTRPDQPAALKRLRSLKQRERKPLALMFPSLERLEQSGRFSTLEKQLLTSAAAPIVLLQRQHTAEYIDPLVAPGLDRLGVMLPGTALQHLLLQTVGMPLVVTSANRREEPLCYRNDQLVQAFGESVDGILSHDMHIQHPLDDSILQVAAGRQMMLRRARGYELEFARIDKTDTTAIAAGADLKNCPAVSAGGTLLIAPHVGSLESAAGAALQRARLRSLCELYQLVPQRVVCDKHPAYHSRQIAAGTGLPMQEIQHHRAHLYAGLAENPAAGRPLLAVSWDGTGYGDDGTIWGGEFFLLDERTDRRLASLRPFPLPGGEQAIREPRRVALSLLYCLEGPTAIYHQLLPDFDHAEKELLLAMLQNDVNSPLCSSVGRLFDGVAALLARHFLNDYEGEAAVLLEQLAARWDAPRDLSPWPLDFDRNQSPWQLDWRPMLRQLLLEMADAEVPPAQLAARFHVTMAHAIIKTAEATGSREILLGGGCFQNRLLLEQVQYLAAAQDITVHWPRQLPPGDGGIAAGQLFALLTGATDN